MRPAPSKSILAWLAIEEPISVLLTVKKAGSDCRKPKTEIMKRHRK